MGRLIPAGTGLEFYRNFKLLTEAEPPAPEVTTPVEAAIPALPLGQWWQTWRTRTKQERSKNYNEACQWPVVSCQLQS